MRRVLSSNQRYVTKIDTLQNKNNVQIIKSYHKYLVDNDKSSNAINNTMKLIFLFSKFLESKYNFIELLQINNKDILLLFLDSKKKGKDEDPEQRWITTWNDYLHRLVTFFRWIDGTLVKKNSDPSDWITPQFCKIKPKRTKRFSPYSENEIWTREELLKIVKYESNPRNKAIITLMWDLNARPHEITLLKIKNVRLGEKYGEGEIPHQAKTGSGPILLTLSFPYVRDWLNVHPLKNEPNAYLIGNYYNGSKIETIAIWQMMNQLRKKIQNLVEKNEITEKKELETLKFLLNTKKWNPYCLRHSSITSDSDYLPEYALKKKVRWSMNSRQGSRYIKNRMGDELKNKILEQNGIMIDQTKIKKSSVTECPRCSLINQLENKYCSKCSYPITMEAYKEIKSKEYSDIEKLKSDIEEIKNLMLMSQK